ncbi:MAG TPA: sulfite exporter TauE/SafE family protein, partial [Clostridia bacterium]|nr:sulfite exporter TauE/SafE family protein [Clostridia bacterium]
MSCRGIYNALMAGSRMYGKWEINNSRFILERRKKFLIVLVIPLIIFAGIELAFAQNYPSIIGGSSAFAPSFATLQMFFVSLLIGVIAGLLTGCIGAGGGFILTPALMSVGVKGIMAVGTDMFHIFAKAIMGATLHRKMGNVNVGLAAVFVIGSLTGATAGGVIQRGIYETNPALSDAFIGSIYVLILGFIGFFTLFDFLRSRKNSTSNEDADESTMELTSIAKKVQSIKLPPYIKFDQHVIPGGRRLSIYPIIGIGFFIGFIAAIMGIGGGFVFFPSFVYLLGVSTFTTVGTDIFQIIFTAGYTSISQYAVYGFVFYTLATGLLLGSLIGIQVGAITTQIVPGIIIRGFFAITVLGGFANRAFALPGSLTKAGYLNLDPSLISILDSASFY